MEPETTPPRIKSVVITLEVRGPESVQVHSIQLDPQEVCVIEPLLRLMQAHHLQAESNTQ